MKPAGVLNIESAVEVKEERPRFWRRQFHPEATMTQTAFDALFGIVLPLLCFIFDPLVFRGGLLGTPLMGPLQFLAYTIAFIEIATLSIWLFARERVGAYSVAIGGFLYAGALISFLIGVVLLPLTLIGLIFIVGILGFTPFITAIVFWRNARRAVTLHSGGANRARKLAAFALGMIFVVGMPLMAHLKISRDARDAVQMIQHGDVAQAEDAIERLRLIGYLTETNTDELVWTYSEERDEKRRERLARAYTRITGEDIEKRLMRLRD